MQPFALLRAIAGSALRILCATCQSFEHPATTMYLRSREIRDILQALVRIFAY